MAKSASHRVRLDLVWAAGTARACPTGRREGALALADNRSYWVYAIPPSRLGWIKGESRLRLSCGSRKKVGIRVSISG